ncbi:helix-turn-helix domain-containing protein [Niallia circulans]|uniref:helix-turn-helix domain-containing protein n=1 Tax=Niallia circulans TaxID=1397 RepID=UPI0015613B24|nr:helix-turn-helix transcriptional regulator [Niallia circulans]NRG30678.1 helix-turn-helix transcriptional regulator [Niallia circulans]
MLLYNKVDTILKERGMTKKKLAELTGLTPNMISEITNNQRSTINRKHIGLIASVLEIHNPADLFEFRND